MGLEVRRVHTAEELPFPTLREPMEALYANESMTPFAFMSELRWWVTRFGFGYGEGRWHPFVKALREYAAGEATDYEGSFLERYYSVRRPATNAKEVLLGDRPGPRALIAAPPLAAVLPWDSLTPGEMLQLRRRVRETENRRAGVGDVGPEEAGVRKGRVEFARLVEVYESIRRQGYRRFDTWDGDICGVILENEGTYRMLLTNGGHRAAALAALGWEAAPIRVRHRYVVRAQDAEYWPQVQRGVWEKEEALDYFFQLFHWPGEEAASEYGLSTVSDTKHTYER